MATTARQPVVERAPDVTIKEDDYNNFRYAGAVTGALILLFLMGAFVWANRNASIWEDAAMLHPQASIGLPLAAILAFVLVTIFRATEGQIRVELLQLKFVGASGPLIMWVICFLAIAAGIKLLW